MSSASTWVGPQMPYYARVVYLKKYKPPSLADGWPACGCPPFCQNHPKYRLPTTDLLKHDDRDSLIVATQVGILFPLGKAFEQGPSGFIGDAPVLAGNQCTDDAVLRRQAQLLFHFNTQDATHATPAVTMSRLHRTVP